MSIFEKLHDSITHEMANSEFVENYLIAKVETDEGEEVDCIYCTILRNATIFGVLGLAAGVVLGRWSK